MSDIISFGKEFDKGHLGKIDMHPMLVEALDFADDGTGTSLDIIEEYLTNIELGVPTTKAIAKAIVTARQSTHNTDIL